MRRYDEELLKNSLEANHGRPYQQCSISVMDTIADPNITFDADGVCNYYYEYKKAAQAHVFTGEAGREKLATEITKIKTARKNKPYDCILGLSGGVDSTYLCLLAKEHGLHPLIVHCDNGWNSELAQHNIEQTVNRLGFDLFTYVINWEEFRELQLSYLKASVVDIEVLTDHAFMAVLYEQARKWKIKYVLAGMNIVTEQVLPSNWIFNKEDSENIKQIYRKFGKHSLKDITSYPFLSHTTKRYCKEILKMQVITPLNYINYQYDDVKAKIKSELGWRDYGGKHYESIWTRFYQGYILPNKFNIDKRKAHLSNLIFSDQLSKEDALKILSQPPYPEDILQNDMDFVIKKFGLTQAEFADIIRQPRIEHAEYGIQRGLFDQYFLFRQFRPLVSLALKVYRNLTKHRFHVI